MIYRPLLPTLAAAVALCLSAAAPVSAEPKPAVKAKGIAVADPQTLVRMGKRPAFYDPSDLSKLPVLSAKAALLMDADTGQILWEKNGRLRLAPASTTKILTALVFIEHVAPEAIVTCTDPKITRIEPSSLHIKPWEKISAQDLLYGLMLRSANDGAVVIAQHVAGSVPRFAEMMNEKARELGAMDSQFKNPHGLTEEGHYTTARDLAVIARAAMAEPRFADAVGTPRRTITRSKATRDVVVQTKAKRFYRKFPGAEGIKTGYTRAAGHCFVGAATRDGRRLISVVLGATNSATDDTVPLLGWGFRRFPAVQVARKGDVVGTVAVRGGRSPEVEAVAADDLRATTDRLAPAAVVSEVQGPPAVAPVRAGQEVGRFVVKVAESVVAGVPVVAAADVEPSPVAAATRSSGLRWLLGGALALVLGVKVGTAASKSARRRRRRLAAARGGADRGRPGRHRRESRHYSRRAR